MKEFEPGSGTQQIEKGDLLTNYRIFETDQFLNDFTKIRGKLHKKIREKPDDYVYPQMRKQHFFGNNIKKLVDWVTETWRYRIGKYRLFYEIDEDEKVVSILTIDIRGRAY